MFFINQTNEIFIKQMGKSFSYLQFHIIYVVKMIWMVLPDFLLPNFSKSLSLLFV